MKQSENVIRVNLFSQFEFSFLGTTITAEEIRSHMLIKLFSYVLCHRHRKLSVEELCEMLWEEGESDNPAGALKNLFYRLRLVLHSYYPKDTVFIKTFRGAYKWNEELIVELDAEAFEMAIHQAKESEDIAEQIARLEEAKAYYTNDLLPAYTSLQWILQRNTYDHCLYVECIKLLSSLYEQQKAYMKMELLCMDALKLEPYDEEIHCNLMNALIHQNKRKKAEEYYKKVSKILYSELGITPSKEMQRLYQIAMKEMRGEELDLVKIQKDLCQIKLDSTGSFFCEYGVFKRIYVLEQRQAKRLGISVYCGLITVKSTRSIPAESEAYRKFCAVSMEQLKEVLVHHLRAGDVIARYSPSQYVLLIPGTDYEGGLLALQRICNHFYELSCDPHAKLICNIREME